MDFLAPLTATVWVTMPVVLLVFAMVSNVWPQHKSVAWLAVWFIGHLFAAVALTTFFLLQMVWR